MKITEHPVDVGFLYDVQELQGGHKGVLFQLFNTNNETLVVKFQNEEPLESLAGTHIMERAGATTPAVRQATNADLTNIEGGIEAAAMTLGALPGKFDQAKARFKFCLLMEFAEGDTLKKVREGNLTGFLTVLRDASFQRQLGRIMAADVFAGNSDRMSAFKTTNEPLTGWYHEQNLFIHSPQSGTPTPVAIDNAFEPDPRRVMENRGWGYRNSRIGLQYGSMAAASFVMAKIEAGLIFDRLLDSANVNHPGAAGQENPEIAAARTGRTGFATNVALGAQEAMGELLKRGRDWSRTFREAYDLRDEKVLRAFTVRRRALRLIHCHGLTTHNAFRIAQTDAFQPAQEAGDVARVGADQSYQQWVLINEFGYSRSAADAILVQGLEAYRDAKRSRTPGQQ
jgi:hypothetical protein